MPVIKEYQNVVMSDHRAATRDVNLKKLSEHCVLLIWSSMKALEEKNEESALWGELGRHTPELKGGSAVEIIVKCNKNDTWAIWQLQQTAYSVTGMTRLVGALSALLKAGTSHVICIDRPFSCTT